jgi:hypothetical protein
MKNWNVFYLDLLYYQSTHVHELSFGYVVSTSMCRSSAKICTQLLKESFIMIYLVFYSFSTLMIFVAKNK